MTRASCLLLVSLGAVLPATVSGQCLPPANSTAWESGYAQQLGICLYTQRSGRGQYGYAEAAALCSGSSVIMAGVARLVRAGTEVKQVFLFNYLLSRSFGYTTVWTEAVCNVITSKFYWSNGEPLPGHNCSLQYQRLYLKASLSAYNTFQSELLIDPIGSMPLIPVCEYEVPHCDPTTVAGYSSASMSLSSSPFVNQTVRFNCAPGYYRQSEVLLTGTYSSSMTTAAVIAERHRYYCQFVASGSASVGSATFAPVGSALALESCESIHCKGWQLLNATQIPDAEESYKSVVNDTKMYAFGEQVPIVCKLGYVSYYDETNISTTVECGQSDLNPSLGMWVPPSLSVCSAVQCKSAMPHFDPDKMIAYKAYDRSKDRSYSDGESNRFPFYPNVVSLRCRRAGYFFMDRKYDKSLQCSLPANGSRNIGVWEPVDGTILSSDVMGCKKITCLTNEIVIPAHQSDLPRALVESNLNDSVTLTDAVTGELRNLSIRDITQAFDMPYNTRVRVYCQYPFDMSVTSPDTGRIEMVTTYEVSCASSGTWSGRITACIKRTESIVTSGSRKYTPPAKEADGAQSLGLVVIVILIVFFTTVIVLDLTTITRDIRLMRRNLGRIRIRWRQGKKRA